MFGALCGANAISVYVLATANTWRLRTPAIVGALLWPLEQNQERYPALAALWKAGKREYLGEKIDSLANAQVAYADACARLGTPPQWEWILR